MLKRKITNELAEWKNSTNKKALLIKGLRQVGKTFIIEDFCKNNYENYVYVNFKNNDDFKKVFNNDFDINRICLELNVLIPGSRFIPNKTVIFFDEIQDCSRARACLKPFVLDKRFDVIASGSLLGLKNYNQNKQDIPVGYEKVIEMHPLDFEEFLWAKGIDEKVITYLKECIDNKKEIGEAMHSQLLSYFRQYLLVGGMPSVVNLFINTNDLSKVQSEQRDILFSYQDDFGKHLDDKENESLDKKFLSRILEVYNSIPNQLSKDNNKFNYSDIKKGAKGREYYEAIEWLIDYGLIIKCNNLNNLEIPLEANKIDDVFKIYFVDTGLFMAMFDNEYAKEVLLDNMLSFKGPIYENIAADGLNKNNKKLYYYRKNSGLEIDFIINYNGKVTLLEVKAKEGRTKSATTILKNKEKYNVELLIKLCEKNIGYENNIFTIPYYLTFLIR